MGCQPTRISPPDIRYIRTKSHACNAILDFGNRNRVQSSQSVPRVPVADRGTCAYAERRGGDMAVKVCATALNQGGRRCEVGQVIDSTHEYYLSYPGNFTDPINWKTQVINTGGAFATPIVLTATQSGATILVNDAAGLDFTLPSLAAADVGIVYDFVVTTTITSNSFRVTAAAGDFLNGGVWIADFDTANTGSYFAADGSSHLVMTMNGSTKGGKKGTAVRFTGFSATGWFITSPNVFGDGALATPFS